MKQWEYRRSNARWWSACEEGPGAGADSGFVGLRDVFLARVLEAIGGISSIRWHSLALACRRGLRWTSWLGGGRGRGRLVLRDRCRVGSWPALASFTRRWRRTQSLKICEDMRFNSTVLNAWLTENTLNISQIYQNNCFGQVNEV